MTESHWKSRPEFVACILASSVGTRLFPMASDKLPKHMLLVAGVPLLFRLLTALEATGFSEAVIATAANDTVTREAFLQGKGHTYKALSSLSSMVVVVDHHDNDDDRVHQTPLVLKSATMKVTVVSLPTTCPGTVEALRRVEASGVIPETSHLVVFPGDLLVLDAEPLRAMIHAHRTGLTSSGSGSGSGNKFSSTSESILSAACTVLLADVNEVDEQGHPLKESAKQKKGLLSRDEEESDYVAVTGNSRLVWKQPKLDVEEDKDMIGTTPKLVLPKARLRGGGGLTRVSTEWNDVHCCCFAPWVRRLLVAKTSLQSIQYDLVPLLIARQFRGAEATFGSKVEREVMRDALQSFPNFGKTKAMPLGTSEAALALLANTSAVTKVNSSTMEFAVLAHVTQASIFRSHTIAAYLYANREIARQVSAIAAVHTSSAHNSEQITSNPCLALPAGASVKPKFHSLLLSNCTVADKVTFKSSVVGRNCKLGANCRLNNVVLQDNVTVGDNTILQNTVIGSNSSVAENCNLNDCQVCPGKSLSAGTKKKGEAFID